MDVDTPLDDLVARSKAKGTKRGAGRRGRSTVGQRAVSSARAKYAGALPSQKAASPLKQQSAMPLATKIVVSNLPTDVNAGQIKDLFHQTVGPVGNIRLSYNDKGVSIGVATIEFKKAEDSTKAYQRYNGRLIDQKHPMKIEIVVDPRRLPAPPLSARVAPAPAAAAGKAASTETGAARGGRARRGTARRGAKERPKTNEDLDAEMESYMKASTTA